MSEETPTQDGMDRRTYLSALGAAGAAGLAGCSGGGGSGSSSEDLGERVPALTVASLGGVAGASSIEQANQHVAKQISEVLGVPAEVTIKELTTLWNEAYSDSRTFSFHVDLSPQFPSNLDPDNLLYSYHITNAGANGNPNVINYANCDFSQKLDDQRTASSTEKRHETVSEALSIASEEVTPTTLCTNTGSSIYRNDQLNARDVGQSGPVDRNPEFLWNTEPINGADAMKSNVTPGNIPNVVYMNNRPSTPWVGTVYMPLLYRDKNYELAAGAAKDWTVENNYQTFTFTLREGMTFHNGDPITAEDAKWTLDFLNDNADTFAVISEYPYESVTAVDDTTLRVEMSKPAPSWLNGFVPIWTGILPKDVWQAAGAEEDPMGVEFDRIIGSGPYQVRDFQSRQILALEPYEDHYLDVNGGLIFRGYSDRQSARRALQSGSLNILLNSTSDTNEQVKNSLGDKVTVVTSDTFVSYELRAQHSFAPSMFREFRLAVSQALNRTRLNAYFNAGTGTPELHSSFAGKNHPWRPESDESLTKIADSPQPNTETSKQVLRDAGWGWDGNGRLHYPPEKDLTPRWPEGSAPCEEPDSFPCVPDICE